MRIGEAVLTPVIEMEDLRAPPQLFVGEVTPEELAARVHSLSPQFVDLDACECRVSDHAWLIEFGGKRILVDPCVGHQRSRPAMPMFDMIESPFLERLEQLGASPESIDYVFCTHLHLDHVGWNTRLRDGAWVPTFPNARYLFSRAEEQYWRREMNGEEPADPTMAGVFAECIEPVVAAGLADMVEAGDRIAGCITLIDAAGHTAGQVAGLLESGGQGFLLAGDVVHHPIQVAFLGGPMIAQDQAGATATLVRLLDLCADKDYWFAPAHFRAPHACKVRKEGGAYRMEWG